MQTQQLLFELSHPVRFAIMQTIAEKPQRMTKIGEQVDANNPEVSRHLDRLRKSRLVGKDPDGFYSTTSFGRIIMSMLPGISFAAGYPDYFLEHDLSLLPPEFMARLGELSSCEYSEGTLKNLGISKKLASEAEEYAYLVAREIPDEPGNFHSKCQEGMRMRAVVHEDSVFPETRPDCPTVEGGNRLRVVPELPVIMVLTEKSAALMFPTHKGTFDFTAGFSSTDESFRKWCGDLFEYLWEKGDLPGTAAMREINDR